MIYVCSVFSSPIYIVLIYFDGFAVFVVLADRVSSEYQALEERTVQRGQRVVSDPLVSSDLLE